MKASTPLMKLSQVQNYDPYNKDSEIDLIWLQKQNIEWDNGIFGTNKGVIHSIEISDRGVRLYVLAFGQNTWLELKDVNKTWRVR